VDTVCSGPPAPLGALNPPAGLTPKGCAIPPAAAAGLTPKGGAIPPAAAFVLRNPAGPPSFSALPMRSRCHYGKGTRTCARFPHPRHLQCRTGCSCRGCGRLVVFAWSLPRPVGTEVLRHSGRLNFSVERANIEMRVSLHCRHRGFGAIVASQAALDRQGTRWDATYHHAMRSRRHILTLPPRAQLAFGMPPRRRRLPRRCGDRRTPLPSAAPAPAGMHMPTDAAHSVTSSTRDRPGAHSRPQRDDRFPLIIFAPRSVFAAKCSDVALSARPFSSPGLGHGGTTEPPGAWRPRAVPRFVFCRALPSRVSCGLQRAVGVPQTC